MRKWILPTICILLLTVMSCSLLDRVTPAFVSERARLFVDADPNEYVWPTLHTLENLRADVFSTYRDNLLVLRRAIEDKKNVFGDVLKVVDYDIEESREVQKIAVGTEAQPGILWSVCLGGVSLAAGRKYFRRPGDMAPEEVEVEKAKAKEEGKKVRQE